MAGRVSLLLVVVLLVAPACSLVEEGTDAVGTDSLYPGPQLEFLTAASDYVAFVDPDDVEFVEVTDELTGYEVRVYRLAAGTGPLVAFDRPPRSPAPTQFVRDPRHRRPIEQMHRSAETLMIFFGWVGGPGPDAHFGIALGLDADGNFVPLDGEEVGDLLTAEFEALRAVAEERSLTLPEALVAYAEEARARLEEPAQPTAAGTDGATLWAAVEGAAEQDPAGALAAWEATPRNERRVRHNVAPNAVMRGREDLMVRVSFAVGTTEGRQGQALMLADPDGILYAWEIATGTHTGGLSVRPGDPIDVLYATDFERPLTAEKIGGLPGIEPGLYGFEVVVDATAAEPAVTLGRTFADERALMEAEAGFDLP